MPANRSRPRDDAGRVRAAVTASIRDARGRLVAGTSKPGSKDAALSFETTPLAPGVYEVTLRLVVPDPARATEHSHRFTFTVA